MAAARTFYIHDRLGAQAVKQGFCWPAFFFGSLWAAAKRIWFPAFFAMLMLDTGLWFLTGYAGAQHAGGLALLGMLLTVAYAYFRGRWGNRWLTASLLSQGYLPGKTLP